MYDRANMKREVRQIMSATRPRPMLIALLYTVLASVGASLIQGIVSMVSGSGRLDSQFSELLLSGQDIEDALLEMVMMYADRLEAFITTVIAAALITSVLAVLWQGLMRVGFDGYCLSVVKAEKPPVNRLFCGFPMFGKVILTDLLVWVFTMLWSLLYSVGLTVVILIAALVIPNAAVSVVLVVLALVVFFVLEIRLGLRYAMAHYVLLDRGVYGLEAVTASKQMMKGRKGKLFMLHLSFIGWYLLMYVIALVGSLIAAILIGVGYGAVTSIGALGGVIAGVVVVFILMFVGVFILDIWLLPYINGSIARFYLAFKPQETVQSEGWPKLGDTTVSEGTQDYE